MRKVNYAQLRREDNHQREIYNDINMECCGLDSIIRTNQHKKIDWVITTNVCIAFMECPNDYGVEIISADVGCSERCIFISLSLSQKFTIIYIIAL